ncbi:unnamed protein product [Clavelina lepadiformis]|uniref:Uncharacterized protein n=1 Tax=Clavelina lepadiformis TaxID=159417 RepID=A0ABP0G295_CLALP
MNQRQYTASVQDMLRNLENVFKNQTGAPQTGPYSKEGLILRTDNIIFRQAGDWRGQQVQVLSPLEELELIDELCIYLQEQKHEYVRYRVFETLFSTARDNALEYRREILCRLVSLGVASKSAAVLECAALWMKSCEKEHASYLASALVTDYCTLQRNGVAELKSCCNVSSRFCCVFMIAVTSKYNMLVKNNADEHESEKASWPCAALLDVVQSWLMFDPALCFCTATQMDKLWRTVLKATQSMLDSLSLTPLDGLARWCVKSVFAPTTVNNTTSTQPRDEQPAENSETLHYQELHSRLHYAFLKALLASKPALKAIAKGSVLGNPDLQLWNKTEVHTLIGDLMALCDHSDLTPQSSSSEQAAVDRFAQIAQIAMSMRVLNCTKDQFQSLSDPLPKTRLLELVAYGPKRRNSSEETPMETGY